MRKMERNQLQQLPFTLSQVVSTLPGLDEWIARWMFVCAGGDLDLEGAEVQRNNMSQVMADSLAMGVLGDNNDKILGAITEQHKCVGWVSG
jgi:hypothetical protein